jgi:linoleoyl-CoA desaturase
LTLKSDVLSMRDPDTPDLVPSESSAASITEPAGPSSFPKVLRRRLDRFFADQNIPYKADRTMWVKIAVGLAVLAGSWISLYTLRLDP